MCMVSIPPARRRGSDAGVPPRAAVRHRPLPGLAAAAPPPRGTRQMFRFASWPASPLLHWRCRLDRVGDACGRSSAVTRRCRGSASNVRRMGNPGRHQARGRWRAVLARHRWYAVFGAGAGTAALAGVVMISLPHHSPSSNADCGRMTCAGTLPPVSAPASPHGRQPARLAISAAP